MLKKVARILVSLTMVSSVLVVFAPVATAATLLVDDEVDCDDSDGAPYYCTIRAAVEDATNGDIIEIAAGTFDTGVGSFIVDTFDEVKDLTFRGQGEGVTIIDGGGANAGIRLYGPATYVVEDLSIIDTVSAGSGAGITVNGDVDVTLTDVTIDNADATAFGGGIYSLGDLTLNGVTIINSSSANGSGGGIFSLPSASLQIFDSDISDNEAATTGGGIHSSGSGVHDIDIVRTTISGNTAADNGGGVYFSVGAGNLDILDTEFDGNTVTAASVGGGGGGLFVGSGISTVDRSLFYDNTSNDDGGGILDTTNGGLTITNTTFYSNTATAGDGGGAKTNAVINNATFVGNTAGDDGGGLSRTVLSIPTMRNSLAAGNVAGDSGPDCYQVLSDGYNLVADSSSCFTSFDPTNSLNVDPGTGTFDDHGGETRTWSIDLGGNSDGAGNPADPGSGGSACEGLDQRGFPRTDDCDAGAYELMVCNGLEATILGTMGEDDILGTAGPDVIMTFDGADLVYGQQGDDTLCLGDGDDTGWGEEGNDTIFGEGDNDTLVPGSEDDEVDGGDGSDTVSFVLTAVPVTVNLLDGTVTGEGTDTLVSIENVLGGEADDTIIGDGGDNTLRGGTGDDSIYPAGGTDHVEGGGAAGVDALITDLDADGATEADPVEIQIQSKADGQMWAEFGASGADPVGYVLFDTAVTVTAPANTVGDPVVLSFLLDSSEHGGVDPSNVGVFKDGVLVAGCVGAAGEANPNPCVETIDEVGDDIEIVVYSTTGSEWAFGEADPDPAVTRYAGPNRFATAAAISEGDFSDPGAVDLVFVAVGTNFPDALAGAAIAGKLGAPLLLVNTASIPTETVDELTRLDPDDVVILGGTAVISNAVRDELVGMGFAVERLAGANRYETAAAISQYGFEVDGSADEVVVATGLGFADALAGAPAAVEFGGPVLLTDPNALPDVIRDEIIRLDPDRIVVLGGTAAVSAAAFDDLDDLAPAVRLAGANRYSTAVAISEEAFGAAGRAYVATGLNFPDALAGAAAAASYSAPVLLETGSTIPTVVSDEILRLGSTTVIVLGGTSVVTVAVETDLGTLIGA